MNRKKLNRIFLFCAAGVLLALTVAGVQLARRKEAQLASETPVIIAEQKADIVDVLTVETTPAPTSTPEAPVGTVTLLVDRIPVLTLASESETQRLLWEYLRASAVAPEGETFVSARFGCELLIGESPDYAEPVGYDDALRLLSNAPDIVPVEVVTRRIETTETGVEETESTLDALAKGTRIIVQQGSGAKTVTSILVTYRGGAVSSVGEPSVQTVHEARATIVKNGGYSVKDPSGEPDDDEGEKGKDAGELQLKSPMRGKTVSHFGFRNGSMHSGMDVSAKAGTEITAPAEGLVVYCAARGAYGFVVDIDHDNGFVSRLTHLADVSVELNQRVFAGERIGALAEWEGADGKPHLHYELIIDNVPYNPAFYLDK